MSKTRPEIIAPAGDLEKLRVALHYGADAVYCGLPALSLRARENEFTLDQLVEARRLTKAAKVKMYLTTNIFPRAPQLPVLTNFLKNELPKIKPDALIVADAGVLNLVKTHAPRMKVHLSVQANTVNSEAVKFWYKQGVRRVIVARELSLYEIQAIHAACPRMELEAFVHGSICFTYSGRCLISNWLTYRDGNRGTCANSCRWKYESPRGGDPFLGNLPRDEFAQSGASPEDSHSSLTPCTGGCSEDADEPAETGYKSMSIVEESRPGQTFELVEDQHGSYLFNSKDLCLIEQLEKLREAGVVGYKIEGRHKSVGYLGTIVRAYKKALTDVVQKKPFDQALIREVTAVANRGYTMGFFDGSQKDLQNYSRKENENPHTFLGIVEAEQGIKDKRRGFIVPVRIKNRFEVGESVEIVTPNQVLIAKVLAITKEPSPSPTTNTITVAHGGAGVAYVDFGIAVPPLSIVRRA